MTPEERIEQALKVADTGAMMQFGKDSAFAQALRDLLAEREARQAALRDTVAFIRGDISGPAQRKGILEEADRALGGTP